MFAVLVVGDEYGSGSIRAPLAAVPRRGLFYACKLIAAALPVLGVSLITVLATFSAAQAALGTHTTSLGADDVPRAIVGACLYLLLIYLFAAGVAMMLRSSVRSLAMLLPLFFLGSQGLGNFPKVKTIAQYLPDQAGMVIMHCRPARGHRFARAYGPWTGMGIFVLWTAAVILGGYLVLRRRDA